ncbi:hypothetical protein ACQUSR_06755 [Streptomyces sp. P1-3]|uniref:hypothetical protein n=1 Tax=Streptomyces sp. P1-3 TaxID=3421658 RepID=UPI003D35B012
MGGSPGIGVFTRVDTRGPARAVCAHAFAPLTRRPRRGPVPWHRAGRVERP